MDTKTIKTMAFAKDIFKSGGHIYLVGGSVRDELLGLVRKDFDLIITKIPFGTLSRLLKKHGRLNLVGKSFGIIKFRPGENRDHELDIALPRRELSTGSGHRDFEVDFDPELPIEQDLLRRDFTINAIAHDIATDELIDPYGGKKDLGLKLIRTVFENSFAEDPLRLMRAVQFAARFGFTIEKNTFEQMQKQAELIRTVAKERIMEEVRKLFTAPKPSDGFDIMRDTGLLHHVFPDVERMIGIKQPKKNNEDVYTHTMKVLNAARVANELEKPGDINIMFAALFHDAGKPKTRRENPDNPKDVSFHNHQIISRGIVRRWLKDFRATTIGVNPEQVCHLVNHHMFETKEFHNEKALRRFIRKVGTEHVFDLLDLRLADKKGGRYPQKVFGILKLRESIREEINRKPPFTAKDLAMTGHDIMNMGFKPGPVIGKIQKLMLEHVIEHPELNTKESLKQLILDNRKQLEASSEKRDDTDVQKNTKTKG